MSTEAAKPADSKDKPAAPADAAAPAKKPSAIMGILKVVVTAVLAAGASFGGSLKGASAHPAPTVVCAGGGHGEGDEHGGGGGKHEAAPPGPTLPLDAFLLTVYDAARKPHPMKLSLAIEFDAHTKEDLKNFVPRIRDAVLGFLRTVTYEQMTDPTTVDKIRADLLERCKAAGAGGAQRVLVTDFVVQ